MKNSNQISPEFMQIIAKVQQTPEQIKRRQYIASEAKRLKMDKDSDQEDREIIGYIVFFIAVIFWTIYSLKEVYQFTTTGAL